MLLIYWVCEHYRVILMPCGTLSWTRVLYFTTFIAAQGIQRMQRKFMEKLRGFLCPPISLVHSSQVKSSLSSQPLFISEAVIFVTEKRGGGGKSEWKEVNLQSLETTELLNKTEPREGNCRGIKDVCVVGCPRCRTWLSDTHFQSH